ncbi:MAG: RNA polymerase sigma factor [Syntrophobacteraceae bacterium]
MNSADDQNVIDSVLSGDTNAYAVLVERYQRQIFNMLVRMTGSIPDASDLSQDTFITAFEQLHRFEKGKRFFPWLYTIALNKSKNFLRRGRAFPRVSAEECELGSGLDYPGQQEEILCLKLDSNRLPDALMKLPADYREALILRFREDLRMDEIAEALKISISGAKMRVHRGLGKLKELLDSKDRQSDRETAETKLV